MATYKVIQDIEAEDKFVGPLTLKQFIFAAITVVTGYITFLLITKHVWFVSVPLWPIMIAGAFLAFPWGRDQPTETWLLAKVRFYFKPRLRIWDQSGVEQLVTVTAPKKIEENLSDNLSQTEVRSRLKALADTIDTRGWVVKNVNVNLSAQPSYNPPMTDSDRLVGVDVLPQNTTNIDVRADDDILDEKNNPLAQHLEKMISASTQEHRQEVMEHMQEIREQQASQANEHVAATAQTQSQNLWFLDEPPAQNTPAGYATFSAQNVTAQNDPVKTNKKEGLSKDEQALLEKVHKEKATEQKHPYYGHMRVLEPLSEKRKHKKPPANREQTTSSKPVNPDILGLANNNDRNVASLAKEANEKRKKELGDGEVVISLR